MATRRTAPRKTDAERGPLGAWAYNTRTFLDGSPEDAATAAGITYQTLRKIEGGSTRQPARRTVYNLWQHLRRLGKAQGIPVEDPPKEWRGDAMPTAPVPAGDLATAITDLVVELQQWRTEDRERIAALERFVFGEGAARQAARKRRAGGVSPKRSAPPKTAG